MLFYEQERKISILHAGDESDLIFAQRDLTIAVEIVVPGLCPITGTGL